jgi:hypothetical protein
MPPSSARVKNEWSYTSATSVCLCDVDGESYVTKEMGGRRKHKNALTRAPVDALKSLVWTSAASQTRNSFVCSFREAEEIIPRLGYPLSLCKTI